MNRNGLSTATVFFTKLVYNENFIKLANKSLVREIEHESKVLGGIRKAPCDIKMTDSKSKKAIKI